MNTTMLRKSALGIAGLAFAGGLAAGPMNHGAPGTAALDAKPVAVAVQADKPDTGKLIPHGTQGDQSHIDPHRRADRQRQGDHRRHQEVRPRRARRGHLHRHALQESKLENLGHLGDRNDHDSLGLFQQRPSSGWGTPEQITDPIYSTTAFQKGLKQVDGWQDMPLTDAAQTVQVSAYPDAYAQWEKQAADLVAEHWNS